MLNNLCLGLLCIQRIYEEDVSKDETKEEEEKTAEPEKVF